VAIADLHYQYREYLGHCHFARYDAAIPAALDSIWKSGLGQGQSVLRLLGARYVLLPVDDRGFPAQRDRAPARSFARHALYRVPAHCRVCSWWDKPRWRTMRSRCAGFSIQPSLPAGLPGSRLSQV